MSKMQPAKRLGDLLLERGLISSGQLEQALARQRTTGTFLGALLVDLGFIDQETLLQVLSAQSGIPREPLAMDRVDWSVAKQFPASVLSEGTCFPIRADAESVTVAIANPLEAWALSAVEQSAHFRRVTPVLVSEAELEALLQGYRQRSLRSIAARLDDHGRPKAH